MIRGVRIHKIGDDRLLFRFDHVVDKNRVPCHGPWAFDKNLVVLRPMVMGQDPMDVNLNECDFYVHASGVPFALRHRVWPKFLETRLGNLLILTWQNLKDLQVLHYGS